MIDVYIVKQHAAQLVTIEFQNKSLKWAFIKENLPDMAEFILNMSKVFPIEPPSLTVEKNWLESLEGINITTMV